MNAAAQQYVVYSSGEPDERGVLRPTTVLASFDWLGNGIVFDHAGKIRLKYNQNEGVLLDKTIGPVTHWKWHNMNEPPVLLNVMVETRLPHKDAEILKYDQESKRDLPGMTSQNMDMMNIEHCNYIKSKAKVYKPYQIKMKTIKINKQFSLRLLNQATVYLLFRDGHHSLKLNLGMSLDPMEIVDIETGELGEVVTSYERFHTRTASVRHIQSGGGSRPQAGLNTLPGQSAPTN